MILFSLVGLMAHSLMGEVAGLDSVIERPESHIWDRDDLFRNHPEEFARLSQEMKILKEEQGMEVFLVIYSSLIGEKPDPLSKRCHDAWLGERNDGFVIVLSFYDAMFGVLGRSQPLYNNYFIEEGVLPRVSDSRVNEIQEEAFILSKQEESEIEQMEVFIMSFTEKLRERLEVARIGDSSKDNYHFMAWTALVLLVGWLSFKGISRLMGVVNKRASKSYLFPDFAVLERLQAPYGGGKSGVTDFEKP